MLLEIIGYLMAFVIGLSLALIGGGGSILAVPVLAYLFNLDERHATAYSLFVVGVGALVGGLRQHKARNVDWKTALVFGIPSIIGVVIIRNFVVHSLPMVLFQIGDFAFTRRMGIFGLFAVLMAWAAYSMLTGFKTRREKQQNSNSYDNEIHYNYPLIVVEGLAVGSITGLVGAGGGFLIVPALMMLANVDIQRAVGTSLIIIALKSMLGFFLGDALTIGIDWIFLIGFSAVVILGIYLGVHYGKKINERKLEKGFVYFIMAMAVFMIIMEFVVKA